MAAGYIFKSLPKSAQEALTSVSTSRIKTVAKGAVQGFIQSFFDKNGVNRSILNSVGQTIQFDTDRSFSETGDITKRQLQVTRFFQDIKTKMPCILIVDAGMNYDPTSFSLIGNARMTGEYTQGGTWQGWYPVQRTLPLTILVASNDQDSTDQIHSMLSWMFGELRVLAGGSEIRGNTAKGENWVVTLPQVFNPSTVSGQTITDDPKDQIWSGEISLEVMFQDSIRIQRDWFGVEEGPGVADKADLRLELPPTILIDDTIKANKRTSLIVQNFVTHTHKIIIDNPNIATFDPIDFVITPRRIGKFKVQVLDERRRKTPREGLPPIVVAEKEVEVVF